MAERPDQVEEPESYILVWGTLACVAFIIIDAIAHGSGIFAGWLA